MLFPPGDTALKGRRSRWREIEFMTHEICSILLPHVNLTKTLQSWGQITSGLLDSKRSRHRQSLSPLETV
jgi:hypothetical protein